MTPVPFRPPRLVATDLDGTVVRPDGTVSPRTAAAFTRLADAGTELVFVTGRPPRLMEPIAEAFPGQAMAICSNGAFVYDLAARTVTRERAIGTDILEEAARRLRAAVPGIGLAVEYAHEMAADEVYEPWDWDADTVVHRLDEAALWSRPAPKLVGRHPVLTEDELVALARPAIGDLVTVYHANGLRLVEAIAREVSKAHALAEYATGLGVLPEEIAAFGDMPNDLPMLDWAGTSYAVANAHPTVLAAADHVIPSVHADGVAQTLEDLFPAVLPR
ncbi:HAD family hydrolase (plasmid) [Streptomyces sp. AHU1]|uniref:HAD family hydrolase n=1 Tax=Streptomyces sp. AHU1 TaxID=3377215 RepID=UPI0038781AC0